MEREQVQLTSKDFDQELWLIFDDYVHGHIDRRGFLDRAAKFAIGGVTAAMLLDQLNPTFAAPVVAFDDKRVKAEYVEFDSPKGYGKARGSAYCAAPAPVGRSRRWRA